jgi:hypothetical protein
MKIWLSLFFPLCLLMGTTVNAAPAGEQKFPRPSDSYQDESIPSLSGKLLARVQQEPFNAAAVPFLDLVEQVRQTASDVG